MNSATRVTFQVLANVEEEEDAKAAVKAKAEQDSELLEFKDTTSQESVSTSCSWDHSFSTYAKYFEKLQILTA